MKTRTTPRTLASIAALLVVTAAAAACGESSSDDSPATPIPNEQLSERVASALCDNLGSCCASSGFAYDVTQCKARVHVFVDELLIAPAVKGGATYDARAAGECVSWLEASARSCEFGQEPDACEQIYIGVKLLGAECETDVECAPQAGGEVECESSNDGPRVCSFRPRGKLGDVCGGTCTERDDGTECHGSSTSPGDSVCWTNDGLFCSIGGTCEALGAIGQSCASFDGCVADAFCNDGACQPKLGAGESCATHLDACGDGVFCNVDTGQCTSIRAEGEACSLHAECAGDCRDGVCVSNASDYVTPEFCAGG